MAMLTVSIGMAHLYPGFLKDQKFTFPFVPEQMISQEKANNLPINPYKLMKYFTLILMTAISSLTRFQLIRP